MAARMSASSPPNQRKCAASPAASSGETVDKTGKKAYVMTLRPREQDIRREKATSNICTNQGLLALAATVYLSLMGKHGLQQGRGTLLPQGALRRRADRALPGYEVDRSKPFFNEFVVKCPRPVREINEILLAEGIIGGYELGRDYLYLYDRMLVCVTEMNTKAEIDVLVDILGEVK